MDRDCVRLEYPLTQQHEEIEVAIARMAWDHNLDYEGFLVPKITGTLTSTGQTVISSPEAIHVSYVSGSMDNLRAFIKEFNSDYLGIE